MKSFTLPDLGEGLQEAEIIAWHVAEGDHVVADQPLVAVETEKAVVEVPSPQAGRIAQLVAKPGERVKVGAVIAIFGEGAAADAGTVVGELAEAKPESERPERVLAAPSVRAFAREVGVDLSAVTGSGPGGAVTRADVEHVAAVSGRVRGEPLRGMRRAMAINMVRARAEVAPATVWDQADIESWWSPQADISVRLVWAIGVACGGVPALNAHYDGKSMVRELRTQIDLGIAVDTEEGLIVPVIRDIGGRDLGGLRRALDELKAAARARTVALANLRDATITLSNFGTVAGRQATLVVVPPQVAIVGAGRAFPQAVPVADGFAFRHMLPLSLTFDHRVVTGGEAARFLKAMIDDLERMPGDPGAERNNGG